MSLADLSIVQEGLFARLHFDRGEDEQMRLQSPAAQGTPPYDILSEGSVASVWEKRKDSSQTMHSSRHAPATTHSNRPRGLGAQ